MAGPAPHQSYGFNEEQRSGQFPLKMVGGSNFGRYPKISNEQSWNMIVSDNFMVPYAGYKNVVTTHATQNGRGAYASTIGNIIIGIFGSAVFKFDSKLTPTLIGNLSTVSGNVYISENNNKQIAITDGVYVYVYNYSSGIFYSSNPSSPNTFNFPFSNPGYISFQNGRFIVAVIATQSWILSAPNDALTWTNSPSTVGSLQSKPSYIQAVVPVPGQGSNILVVGQNVAESWQDLGLALFPYQRNSSFNIDYGCLNPASIASLENFVVWLSYNETSGPELIYTSGGPVQRISTDGIDYKLATLTEPTNVLGFLFRQDGHLIYQFTFIADNLSYAYDFNTQLFFNISDEDLNYHIARDVVFFNNQYYFVSINDSNLYQFGTQFTDADYGNNEIEQLPRIRITPPMRMPDQRYFIGKSAGFTIEQGRQNNVTNIVNPQIQSVFLATETLINITTEAGVFIDVENDAFPNTYSLYSEVVDISISRDGGETFGSSLRLPMNPTGSRLSRFIFQRLGIVNDITFQFRFSGFGRFVFTDGIVEVYQ